jgi:hypothetical protein
MKPTFSGGCLCGAIRYECTAKPEEIQMFRCHCRDCQQVTGGAFSPVVFVPARTVKFTRGSIRHHFTASEAGGKHKRGFCPDCGCRLTGGEGEGSSSIGFTASSLDDPTFFKPQFDMWVSDTEPWEAVDPSLPRFEKYPPGI